LKRAYLSLEEVRPGFLEAFSRIEGTKRRYVAKDLDKLHPDPQFAAKHAFRINSEWWALGNCSFERAQNHLKQATALVGLKWDHDVRVFALHAAQESALDELDQPLASALQAHY
jgi:hypothetical protein